MRPFLQIHCAGNIHLSTPSYFWCLATACMHCQLFIRQIEAQRGTRLLIRVTLAPRASSSCMQTSLASQSACLAAGINFEAYEEVQVWHLQACVSYLLSFPQYQSFTIAQFFFCTPRSVHSALCSRLHKHADLMQVAVNGDNVPAPITSFEEAAWDEKVALNVKRCKYRWSICGPPFRPTVHPIMYALYHAICKPGTYPKAVWNRVALTVQRCSFRPYICSSITFSVSGQAEI